MVVFMIVCYINHALNIQWESYEVLGGLPFRDDTATVDLRSSEEIF